MTVLEVLTAATGYLGKQGVESPRLSAEHLLAHVLGKRRLDLYLEFDRPLSDAERAPLRELIRKRGTGRPLQHLLGTVEFHGRTFRSDARALIPRPETEQLVELVLAELKSPDAPRRIIDVGTGSGVIAITLALARPDFAVEAVDLSADALDLARTTADDLAAAVTFHESDLLPAGDERWDAIVANLPYIPTADLATLQREVQCDPPSALDGGADGLRLIDRLSDSALARLNSGGLLALEIGHDQSDQVKQLLSDRGLTEIRCHPDHQGIERFVTARNP